MGLLVNHKNELFISYNRNDIVTSFYDELKNNLYDLFIKKDGNLLVFLAVYKSLDKKESIAVHFSLDGEPLYYNSYDPKKVTLVKFLYDLENDILINHPDDITKLYLPLGNDFASDLLLDEKTRKEKNSIRETFLTFIKDEDLARFTSKSGEVESYEVIYAFEKHDYEDDRIYINITIIYDRNKKRKIQRLDYYFDALLSAAVYSQAGIEIYTAKEYYSSLDYELLLLLAKNNVGYGNQISISNDAFIRFILNFKNHTIMYNNEPYKVLENEIEEDFILDEKGEFKFNKYDGETFASDKYVLEFVNHRIYIHTYPDPLLMRLAYHLAKYTKKELSYIHDLVLFEANKSINFKISKTEGYLIHLYVDLSEEDELLLSTKFFKDEIEISKEDYLNVNNNKLIYEHYLKELDHLGIKENGKIINEGIILNFLTSDYKDLSRFCLLYLSSRIKGINHTSIPTVNVSVRLENDWLNLDFANNEFSDEEMEEILLAYKHKKKFYLVKNKLITFKESNEALDSLLEMASDYDIDIKDLKEGKFPKYAYFSLINYHDASIKVEQNKYIDEFSDRMTNYLNTPISLNEKIKKNIRPYQEKGIKWLKTLYELNLGAVLADDMGLGKSLQTVGLISEIKEDKPILIICPKSVTYNWANEIALWGNNEEVVVLTDNKSIRQAKVKEIDNDKRIIYITSYDSLRNDLDFYDSKEFSLLVADEAQFIKNAYAKKAKAIKNINAHFKLALTGTPIENSLADLWSIFDLIMKGYLSSFEKFKNKYISNPDNNELLKKKVSPFIMRRIKDDVLKDLPKKEVLVQTISMSENERNLYDASLRRARHKLEESDSSFSMLPVLTSLREICVDPMVFYDNYNELSSKFNFLLDVIPSALESNHKFLIFSSFASVLHHLEKVLAGAGISTYLIDGEVKAITRLAYADDFNKNKNINVMLVSLKAGGTGLNLYGADIVIHLDPWWNFASEEQATDRAHRIGQKRPVTVYKLIMHNSIEEKVMILQEKKKELNQEIIGVDNDNNVKISKEDIAYLLS